MKTKNGMNYNLKTAGIVALLLIGALCGAISGVGLIAGLLAGCIAAFLAIIWML